MFDQCWPNVVDGGPTLLKHWVDVLCLLGYDIYLVTEPPLGTLAMLRMRVSLQRVLIE